KGLPGAAEWDREFSQLRRSRDWNGQIARCIDPKLAREIREKGRPHSEDVCSMCGEYCVFRVQDELD
ncbi:MAG TPA: phosphomethylpyrimidine synthase ThiC, partial [Planctomycetota bacterium]|nr:phosphomethylpyrimidine synthase ThiC [Planctomycetota bacterium]